MRTYSELITIGDYLERYKYLRIGGNVGESTFGYDRYLNQRFYTSKEWKQFRRDVIIRDNGSDMAFDDGEHEIRSTIIIHHLNPITLKDIERRNIDILLNMENVVCVSHRTHEAIHYGDESLLCIYTERYPGDTKLW